MRIGILGATGYTALELILILLRHGEAEISLLTSREETRAVSAIHPCLRGRLDLSFENPTASEIAERTDCVFCCLPHCASASVIPELLEKGCRIVDLSADYRLDSASVFEKWYAAKHPDVARLGKIPYGLPELFRDEIRNAQLVANPGCYPTSAILPLYPLLKAGVIQNDDIIIDSKSGVSGAGKTLKSGSLYCECNESIAAYGIGTHRHTPEIDQILSKGCSNSVNVLFTPHLTPMNRGILTVAYAKPNKYDISQDEVLSILSDFYRNEPFVHVSDVLPATKDVSHTNNCHISARIVGNRILTISVIDNLIKGASGAAVQNFNVMYGFSETTAL